MPARTPVFTSLAALAAVALVPLTSTAAVAATVSCVTSTADVTIDLNDPGHPNPNRSDSDVILGTPGPDPISAGDGNDIILSGGGKDTITGGPGDDVLCAGNGNDTVKGSAGNDLLHGGAGNDILDGGTNTPFHLPESIGDVVFYHDVDEPITATLNGTAKVGTSETDTLVGNEGIYGGLRKDTLTGNEYANALFGNDGKDSLAGGGGNDFFAGDDWTALFVPPGFSNGATGNAADTIKGGSGSDTVDFGEDHLAGVVVKLGVAGASGNETDGDVGSRDSLSGIERVNGTQSNDTITGDAANNRLDGDFGNDVIDGGSGGIDTLIAGPIFNTDTVSYASHTTGVTIDLFEGKASDGDQILDFENATGSPFNDVLIGKPNQPTVLNGKGGIDTVDYSSSPGTVVVSLNGSADDGLFGEGDNVLNLENIIGSNFGDNLTGSASANTFYGGDGNDTLDGGPGADSLYGQSGPQDSIYAEDGVKDLVINGGQGSADTVLSIDDIDPDPVGVEILP